MAHAENEVIINRPVYDVYTFLCDGLNNNKWGPSFISVGLASGEPGQVGAEYRQLLKGPGGKNIAGDYKITAAKPGQELSFAVIAGPARPTGSYYFESAGDGTKLKFVLDYKPRGFAWFMKSMIQKTMDSEVAQLTNLKQVLEG